MGQATATVKGGLFPEVGVSSLTQYSKGSGRRRIRQEFTDEGLRDTRERLLTLNGVAPGSAALEQKTRIQANSELGGKRTIETVSLINRNTVAGDVTEINNQILNSLTSSTSMASPANKDGNPLGTR